MALTYGFTLQPTDDSAAFSDAFRALTGDGIAPQGGQFVLTVNGRTVTLSTGLALAAGRWVKSDEPQTLTIQSAGNTEDRTDALVVQVDYEERKATLEVLVDVDPAAIREDPALLRNEERYCVLLYFIRVRRGATALTPDDVTDLRDDGALCGQVVPLSAVAGDVLKVYRFLLSGIDVEVARLIELSEQVVQKADEAIAELDKDIQQAGGMPEIGELLISRHPPTPEQEWLPCNGQSVPEEYPALSAMLGGKLPSIPGERYQTYIYSGASMEV